MDYKPFLTTDLKYLQGVSSKISGKDPIEEIKFEYLTEAVNVLDYAGDPYKLTSEQSLLAEQIQKLVKQTFTRLAEAMKYEKNASLIFRLWDYLSESDETDKSDLIFTFGGQGMARVDEAIRLYKQGFGSKILFTGKKAAYMPDLEFSEAETYAHIAENNGIKIEDLILEIEAKNTVENAVNSISILKAMKWLPKKIILINHNFQMRRSYLTFKTNVDWEAKLFRHAVTGVKYTRDNFWKDLEGWQFVTYEYFKLYGARLMRHF